MKQWVGSPLLWTLLVGGPLVIGIGVWRGLLGSDDGTPTTPEARVEFRIGEHGRETLLSSVIPPMGEVDFVLTVEDEARGDGELPAVIASEDGRRLVLNARPNVGQESGIRLTVDATFLESGRYLIQVNTSTSHPLSLRRFILEIE